MASPSPATMKSQLILATNVLKGPSKNVSTLPKVYGMSKSVSLWTETYESLVPEIAPSEIYYTSRETKSIEK